MWSKGRGSIEMSQNVTWEKKRDKNVSRMKKEKKNLKNRKLKVSVSHWRMHFSHRGAFLKYLSRFGLPMKLLPNWTAMWKTHAKTATVNTTLISFAEVTSNNEAQLKSNTQTRFSNWATPFRTIGWLFYKQMFKKAWPFFNRKKTFCINKKV